MSLGKAKVIVELCSIRITSPPLISFNSGYTLNLLVLSPAENFRRCKAMHTF